MTATFEPVVIIGDRQCGKTEVILRDIDRELATPEGGEKTLVVFCRNQAQIDALSPRLWSSKADQVQWFTYIGPSIPHQLSSGDTKMKCYFVDLLPTDSITLAALTGELKPTCPVVLELAIENCKTHYLKRIEL